MTARVHYLKPGTERLGDYREPLCGAYNRGSMKFTVVFGLATCKRCAENSARFTAATVGVWPPHDAGVKTAR